MIRPTRWIGLTTLPILLKMFTAVFIGPELALKQWPKHAMLLHRATRPTLDHMSLRLWQPKLSVKRNLRAIPPAPIWASLRLDYGSVNITGNQERYIEEVIRFGCHFFGACHYCSMLSMLFLNTKLISRRISIFSCAGERCRFLTNEKWKYE